MTSDKCLGVPSSCCSGMHWTEMDSHFADPPIPRASAGSSPGRVRRFVAATTTAATAAAAALQPAARVPFGGVQQTAHQLPFAAGLSRRGKQRPTRGRRPAAHDGELPADASRTFSRRRRKRGGTREGFCHHAGRVGIPLRPARERRQEQQQRGVRSRQHSQQWRQERQRREHLPDGRRAKPGPLRKGGEQHRHPEGERRQERRRWRRRQRKDEEDVLLRDLGVLLQERPEEQRQAAPGVAAREAAERSQGRAGAAAHA